MSELVDIVLWGPSRRISAKPLPVAVNGRTYHVPVWRRISQPERVVAQLEVLGFDVERLAPEDEQENH